MAAELSRPAKRLRVCKVDEKSNPLLRIKPLDNQHARCKDIQEPLLNHPHSLIIVAPKGGGKSTLLINMLLNKHMYFRFFDKIYLFSPTASMDPKWDKVYIPPGQKFQHFDPAIIEEILAGIKKKNSRLLLLNRRRKLDKKKRIPRVLFIFDDMVGASKAFTGKLGPMHKLFFNSRHYNASIWVTSQRYLKALTPDLRTQVQGVITFPIYNKNAIKNLWREQGADLSEEDFLRVYSHCMDDPHAFMFINLQVPPAKRWHKCFNRLTLIKS